MSGYLYRGDPALGQINAQIMAARSSGTTGQLEKIQARRNALKARDIPASCSCPWRWSERCDRWVVDNRRKSCPWHAARWPSWGRKKTA